MEAMSENIFERLESDWHAGERHAGDWFHRHAHRNSPMSASGDTISPGEAQTPPASGDTVSLASLATSMKADIDEMLVHAHNVADQWMPQVAEIGEKVESDDLIQAVEAAVLPPEARSLVAEFVTKLSAMYPPAAVPAAPAQEPQAA